MLVASTEAVDSRNKMSQDCGGDDASFSRSVYHSPPGNPCPALEDQDDTGFQELTASSCSNYGHDRHLCLFPLESDHHGTKDGWLEIRLNDANAQGYVGVVEDRNHDSCCFDGDARPDFCRWIGKLQGQGPDTRVVSSRKVRGYSSLKKRLRAVLGPANEERSRLRSCGLVYAIYDPRGWWCRLSGKVWLPHSAFLLRWHCRGLCKTSFCVFREGEVVRSYASRLQRPRLHSPFFSTGTYERTGIKSTV